MGELARDPSAGKRGLYLSTVPPHPSPQGLIPPPRLKVNADPSRGCAEDTQGPVT